MAYKVGDWVRALVSWGNIEAGKVYQIPHLDEDGEPWFTFDGVIGWLDYMTLDEIEPWTPKVGERVRLVKDGKSTTGAVGKSATITAWSDGSHIENGEYLLDIDPPVDYRTMAVTPNFTRATVDCFEPLPVAAEAEPADEPQTVTEILDELERWIVGQDTARAATPAAPVAAQVDAIAEEYGPVIASNDNGKPKFKIGDRVRVVCNKTNGGFPIRQYAVGGVYPITSIVKDLNGNDAVTLSNHHQYLKQGQFVVAATAIVALIEDGQPKPADRPYIHASEEAAATEAKRLAGIHKGKQFGVFVLTTTAEEAKPVYRHEWQRLAADGQKIAAIKELRSLTGMMLKPAKDVVEHFIDGPYNLAA